MLTRAYRILRYRDFPCILCLVCNRISHNPNDVRHRYCHGCHVFLDDLPMDYPEMDVEGYAPGRLREGAQDRAEDL